jgi:hypothetical protein
LGVCLSLLILRGRREASWKINNLSMFHNEVHIYIKRERWGTAVS